MELTNNKYKSIIIFLISHIPVILKNLIYLPINIKEKCMPLFYDKFYRLKKIVMNCIYYILNN